MTAEQLYEVSFEYKKTKLWKAMREEEIFAINLSGGRMGYVSILGASGGLCGLALYIGEEGIGSFRRILEADPFSLSPNELQEYLFMQESLQCVYETKDSLSPEEQEEVRHYARFHGIRISGKNAYPQFMKYTPYYCPWHLREDQDKKDIVRAMSAALEMARLLEGRHSYELGLQPVNALTEEVPMLEWADGKYEQKTAVLPKARKPEWAAPKPSNDIAIANIKRIKKSGTWECGLVRCPRPVRDGRDRQKAPYFPLVLLAVDASTDQILPVDLAEHFEEKPQELLEMFLDALLQAKVCPKEIKVPDQRSYAFVKAFCERMKVKLCIEEELPALEAAECDFMEHFGLDEEDEMQVVADTVRAILELEPEKLREVPEEMVAQMKLMAEMGVLSRETEERLNEIFGPVTPKSSKIREFEPKAKRAPSKETYVISVSIRTGCYRHIRISGKETLLTLHEAIQKAFGFDDDHAYVFFMDNVRWSREDCYYAEGVGEGQPTVSQKRLDELGLEKGTKFKYLFDFGDEWQFQCKVLRVLEKETERFDIIKTVGDAPVQYEDWD